MLAGHETTEAIGQPQTAVTIQVDGTEYTSTQAGADPGAAITAALSERGIMVEVLGLHETRVGVGSNSEALALVEYRTAAGTRWSAGQDRSPLTATLAAVIRAANASPRPAVVP